MTLYVSGTASIDEAGRTVHVGDFEAQVDRMLHNIASLLAGQGATFADLVSGVAYLKNPGDAPVLRAIFRRSAASTASRARSSRRRSAGPSCSAKRRPSRCFLSRRAGA